MEFITSLHDYGADYIDSLLPSAIDNWNDFHQLTLLRRADAGFLKAEIQNLNAEQFDVRKPNVLLIKARCEQEGSDAARTLYERVVQEHDGVPDPYWHAVYKLCEMELLQSDSSVEAKEGSLYLKLEEAAKKGVAAAQKSFGDLALKKQDFQTARYWHDQAAKNGDICAQKLIMRVWLCGSTYHALCDSKLSEFLQQNKSSSLKHFQILHIFRSALLEYQGMEDLDKKESVSNIITANKGFLGQAFSATLKAFSYLMPKEINPAAYHPYIKYECVKNAINAVSPEFLVAVRMFFSEVVEEEDPSNRYPFHSVVRLIATMMREYKSLKQFIGKEMEMVNFWSEALYGFHLKLERSIQISTHLSEDDIALRRQLISRCLLEVPKYSNYYFRAQLVYIENLYNCTYLEMAEAKVEDPVNQSYKVIKKLYKDIIAVSVKMKLNLGLGSEEEHADEENAALAQLQGLVERIAVEASTEGKPLLAS